MTDFQALDDLWPLPPEQLFRQWVLTRDEADVPRSWPIRSLHGWLLAAHHDAHVCTLRAADGTPMGWIIEPMLQLGLDGGQVPGDDLVLPIEAKATAEEVERGLYGRGEDGYATGDGVHGMWVAILTGGDQGTSPQRVYVAPTHSVVFSRDHGVVSTTHNLVRSVTRDVESSRGLDPLATNSYFSFGLTAFVGIHRLLPNHYLDLAAFEPVRHWPRRTLEPLSSGKEGAAAVVEHCRRILAVLAEGRSSFRVFLSAGHDSRAVLALLRPLVGSGTIDVRLATSVGRDLDSRIDARTARELAKIAGLPHEISRREAHSVDMSDVMRAFVRIGEARAGHSLASAERQTSKDQDSRLSLGGMAGETGRAYFWKWGLPETGVRSDHLAKSTGAPRRGRALVAEAAERWLDGLPPGFGAAETLDLAYVEQRLGCWQSPSRYLFPGKVNTANPMAEAFNIETMLRLPAEYRASGMMQRDMVQYGWPELLQVPFNTATGHLRLYSGARRARKGVRRRVNKFLS